MNLLADLLVLLGGSLELPPPICSKEDMVKKELEEKWGERVIAVGKSRGGRVVEIWRNDLTLSWTIVVRTKEERCLILDGNNLVSKGFPL